MSNLSIAFSIFLVMNTLGGIPIFLSILSKYPEKKQNQIILRELCIALGILIAFMFFGKSIIGFLGISQSIMGMAGGIILFIIAIGLIFPKNSSPLEHKSQEPFIVPLAMPLIAGPGTITTVMIYSDQIQNNLLMMGILLMAWIPSVVILLAASKLKFFFGKKGLLALQKLGGMLICLIAIQMICTGTLARVKESMPLFNQSQEKNN